MAHQMCVYIPPISCLSHIPGGLPVGKVICLWGFVPHQSKQFSINLQCGPNVNPRDDISFHVNVKFEKNVIARNHLLGVFWGIEENHGEMPIHVGNPIQILILCEETCFKLAFNGNHFCEFPHRLPRERCSHIAIDGDIVVSLLQFNDGNNTDEPINIGQITPLTFLPNLPVAKPKSTTSPFDDQCHYMFSISNSLDCTNDEYKSLTEYGGFETEEGNETSGHHLKISVINPQKVGNRLNSYITYQIITKTNMKEFSKQYSSVSRRFSDFLGLHDTLTDRYLKRGIIIPPTPEKSIVGMTQVLMSDQSNLSAGSSSFIERRRASLERYLNRTAQNHTLCIDSEFIQFLEFGDELPKSSSTSALSGAGIWRLFYRWRETVNKISYKMDETDCWFIERCEIIDALDVALRGLHSAVEVAVGGQTNLTALGIIAARAASSLFESKETLGISNALKHLAHDQEKDDLLHSGESSTDIFVLCEILKEYIGLIGAIKEVFYERVKVFQLWQHAQLQLTKRRDTKALQERQGSIDIGKTDAEIIQWEAKVDEAQKEFNTISDTIRKEMHKFEITRAKELRVTIIKYLEDHMTDQKQLMKYWKKFVPGSHDYPAYNPEK